MLAPPASIRYNFAPRMGDRRRIWAWLLALLLAAVPFAALADDDLPGRVGRIAEFAGQLFLSPEDRATEWEAIGLNYPVTSGDNLWVSGDGRAEVDYGGGQFRLAGDTNLHVSRLDDSQLALFVAQGRLIVRVRVLDPGDATRVDTPNTQVTLTRPGLYRIEVTPDRQQTTVTVREGEALVALVNGAQQALPGQTASVFGPDPVNADVRNSIGMDGFDTWSANRDRYYERARSTAYVSREMVGYADLDEYGSWQNYPDYGAVWFPTEVAPDWAPYRDGYWANVGGWGFTWVDYAPWGYAPFHYGRWTWIGGRWGWCPGTYVARPIWAPALVGWFGGAGWGLSLNAGAPVYGWVPLGWGEAYLPWWRRCSYNCWTHYNRPYNVNVRVRPTAPPPRYSNIGVPGAVTAVSATTIASRRLIPANRIQVPASLATSAPVMSTSPAVQPGPAPGPRVRPGDGTTPRPASTFIPPSRARAIGAGDGSRPAAAPRGAASSEVPGGAAGAGAVPSGAPSRTFTTPRTDAPVRPSPATVGAPSAGAPSIGTQSPTGTRGGQAGTWTPQQRAGTPPVSTSVPRSGAEPVPPSGAVPVPAPAVVAQPPAQQRRQREASTPSVVQAPPMVGSPSPRSAPNAMPIPVPGGRSASPSRPPSGVVAPTPTPSGAAPQVMAPQMTAPQMTAPVPQGGARPATLGSGRTGTSGRGGERPDANLGAVPGAVSK